MDHDKRDFRVAMNSLEGDPRDRGGSIRAVIVAKPVLESLDFIHGHHEIPELSRWIFPGIPELVSVHEIVNAPSMHRHYCDEHSHADEHEIIVALGRTSDFLVDLSMGGLTYLLGPMASAFIPAGVTHSTNVVSGSGLLVVLKTQAEIVVEDS